MSVSDLLVQYLFFPASSVHSPLPSATNWKMLDQALVWLYICPQKERDSEKSSDISLSCKGPHKGEGGFLEMSFHSA